MLDKLKQGSNENKNENTNYTVYVQFDEDAPLILSEIESTEYNFEIVLNPDGNNMIVIKDDKTKKQIKIFALKDIDKNKTGL